MSDKKPEWLCKYFIGDRVRVVYSKEFRNAIVTHIHDDSVEVEIQNICAGYNIPHYFIYSEHNIRMMTNEDPASLDWVKEYPPGEKVEVRIDGSYYNVVVVSAVIDYVCCLSRLFVNLNNSVIGIDSPTNVRRIKSNTSSEDKSYKSNRLYYNGKCIKETSNMSWINEYQVGEEVEFNFDGRFIKGSVHQIIETTNCVQVHTSYLGGFVASIENCNDIRKTKPTKKPSGKIKKAATSIANEVPKDMKSAALRVVVEKSIELSCSYIISRLPNNMIGNQIKNYINSNVGKAVVAYIIGNAILVSGYDNLKLQSLGEELRVYGYQNSFSFMYSALIEPIAGKLIETINAYLGE